MNLNFSGNGSSNGSDGNNGGGGCIGINGGGPCGACKFLRRKCLPSCIFAPYFSPDQGTNNFAVVHKVFGASNVSKLLQNIPVHKRYDAVSTLSYEAHARLRDPVYGCVGQISALQQQVDSLEAELSYIQGHLAALELTQHQQPPPPPQTAVAPPTFSFGDLHSPSTMAWSMPMPASTYDLSSVFEPMAQTSWATQQRAIGPDQHSGTGPSATRPTTSGDDLQTLARELLLRNGSLPAPPILPCSNASSTPSFSK